MFFLWRSKRLSLDQVNIGFVYLNLQDDIVANVEAKLATWTFLPEGISARHIHFYFFLILFLTQLLSSSFYVLWIRKWGSLTNIALWEWSKIWSTFRLLLRQGNTKARWSSDRHRTNVLVQCHKGWRNSVSYVEGKRHTSILVP